MGDAHGVLGVEHRRADVVRVAVAVDDVGDRFVRDLTHGPQDVLAEGGRRVHRDDALPGGEEHHLIDAVSQMVEALSEIFGQVTCSGNGRSLCSRGSGSGLV